MFYTPIQKIAVDICSNKQRISSWKKKLRKSVVGQKAIFHKSFEQLVISTVEQKDIKNVLRSRIGCYFEILLFSDSHRGHFVIAKGQTHHWKESERVSRSEDEDRIDGPAQKQFIGFFGQFICTVS